MQMTINKNKAPQCDYVCVCFSEIDLYIIVDRCAASLYYI